MAEEIGQIAQHQSGQDDKALAVEQALVYPLAVPGAVVLSGEGQVGLVEGVHRLINKVFNVAGGGRPGHYGGAERVDGGLDEHVGQGEHDALEAGGQSDLEDVPQDHLVHLQLLQIQTQGALLLGQAAQDQPGRDVLGDGGGRGHARHVHMEHQHRKQIQDHIHDPGHDQVVQRTFGVPLGPEDGRAEVVGQGGGHTQEVNAQVGGGEIDHVLRRGHPHQELVGHHKAKDP